MKTKRIRMFQYVTETRKYKTIWYTFVFLLLPIWLIPFVLSKLGELSEFIGDFIGFRIASGIRGLVERIYLFFGWDGVDIVEEWDED